MRILHVTSTGGLYGKEQMILNLLKEQENREDISPHLLTFGNDALFTEVKNRTLFKSGHVMPIYHYAKYTQEGLFRIIDACGIDIIHSHDYKPNIRLALSKLRRKSLPRIINTAHGFVGAGKPFYNRIYLYNFLDRMSWKILDKGIGVSPNMEKDFGLPIIKNGISIPTPHDFEFSHDLLKFCSGGTVVGCVARLSKEKNIGRLIDAIQYANFTQYKTKFKLLLVGEGPERAQLELQVLNNGMENVVKMLGFQPNASRFMTLFDIYCQPSLSEGTPISILEAASSGVPIVATDVGGMSYFIQNQAIQKCDIDAKSIGESLIKVDKDKELAHNLATCAETLFKSEYTSEIMANAYFKIYKQLLDVKQKVK